MKISPPPTPKSPPMTPSSGVKRSGETQSDADGAAQSLLVVAGERIERTASVTSERRAVHQRQRPRRELAETADRRARVGGDRHEAELVLGRGRRADDVA